MLFLISSVWADGGASQSNGWLSFLPMVAFIAILYFLLIRPQQKRQKQHKALVSAVKKGDTVLTNSGIIAKVSKVLNDQEISLEIADGVYCKFIKSAISNVLSKDPLIATSFTTAPVVDAEKTSLSPKDASPKEGSPISKTASSKKVKKSTPSKK
jgi:preprotein translocase subunit YajC